MIVAKDARLARASLVAVGFLALGASKEASAQETGSGKAQDQQKNRIELAEELSDEANHRSHSGFRVRTFAGASFAGRQIAKPGTTNTISYGVEVDYRIPGVDIGLMTEHSIWPGSEFQSDNNTASVLNWGLSVSSVYFNERVRSALVLGGSTMLFSTFLGESGSTGPFMSIRPVGFRFDAPLGVIEVMPLGLSVMVPSTKYIPLVKVAFQTSVGFEWSI